MNVRHYSSDAFRKVRREAITKLEHQQREDSRVSREIRSRFLVGSRKILDALAGFLDSHTPDRNYSEQEKEIFERISPDLPMNAWLAIRRQQVNVFRELSSCNVAKAKAQAKYDADSPLGFISRWGKDQAGERISLALMAENDRLARMVEALEKKSRSINGTLGTHAELFIRAAFKTSSIEWLSSSKNPIQSEIVQAMTEMSHSIKLLWEDHRANQIRSIDEITESLSTLKKHYQQLAQLAIGGTN